MDDTAREEQILDRQEVYYNIFYIFPLSFFIDFIDLFFIKNIVEVNIRSFFWTRKGVNIGFLYVFVLEKTNKLTFKETNYGKIDCY